MTDASSQAPQEAPAPIPLPGLPVPPDAVQHILKYVKFKERGKAATGISTHATAKVIRKLLVSSFFLGGSEEFSCPYNRTFPAEGKLRQQPVLHYMETAKSYGAGWFILRQPKFASRRDDKDFVRKAVEHGGPAL